MRTKNQALNLQIEEENIFFLRKDKTFASFQLELLPFHFCCLLFPGLVNKPKCLINFALFHFVAVNGQKSLQESASILPIFTEPSKLHPSSSKIFLLK